MVYFIPPAQRQTLLHAAQLDSVAVFIQGGPGTGKGALAKWIHEKSLRMTRKLGLFTPKEQDLGEELTRANGSTLVISNLESLTGSEQRLLTHFLKTKSLQITSNLGNSHRVAQLLSTRVICLTGIDLASRSRAGVFSTELITILQRLAIRVPSLSERMEEFEDIASGILREKVRELQKDFVSGITPQAWKVLKSYDWPGNLRELRNVLHLAVMQAKDTLIDESELPNIEKSEVNLLGGREEFERIYFLEVLKMFDNNLEVSAESVHLSLESFKEKLSQHQISTT